MEKELCLWLLVPDCIQVKNVFVLLRIFFCSAVFCNNVMRILFRALCVQFASSDAPEHAEQKKSPLGAFVFVAPRVVRPKLEDAPRQSAASRRSDC